MWEGKGRDGPFSQARSLQVFSLCPGSSLSGLLGSTGQAAVRRGIGEPPPCRECKHPTLQRYKRRLRSERPDLGGQAEAGFALTHHQTYPQMLAQLTTQCASQGHELQPLCCARATRMLLLALETDTGHWDRSAPPHRLSAPPDTSTHLTCFSAQCPSSKDLRCLHGSYTTSSCLNAPSPCPLGCRSVPRLLPMTSSQQRSPFQTMTAPSYLLPPTLEWPCTPGHANHTQPRTPPGPGSAGFPHPACSQQPHLLPIAHLWSIGPPLREGATGLTSIHMPWVLAASPHRHHSTEATRAPW